MKDDIVYEPVDDANYQRTVTALERELGRLKAELLPRQPIFVIERDKQQTIWLELDRVTRHLVHLRGATIHTIHVR